MTREEIMEKVKSFNKYTLSKDEAVEVGLMHRQLPMSERDWGWLANLIHWDGDRENLRKYVLYRAKTLDKVKAEEEPVQTEISTTIDERNELYKIKQQLRDERNAYNKSLRDDSRIERMLATIKEVANNLPDLTKVTYHSSKQSKYRPIEAIAMVSDLHLGVEIDEYCNKYNLDIATKRMDKLAQDIIKYCKLHNVTRLNVVNLGDLISGIIHVTTRLNEEFDVIDQVMKASELMAIFLNKIQEAAPEIIYRSCTDNHARVMANKNENIEKENFYRLVDWYLKERLKKTSIEFKDDNLSENLGKFYLQNGKLVMFAHGHLDNYNKIFQSFIGATEEYVHYALLGHYHSSKTKNFQNMKVFINGSIVGTDQYAESKRLYTKPEQTLLIFDDDNVINYSINLDIK